MDMLVDRKAAVKKLRTLVFSQKMEVDEYREGVESTFASPFLPNNVECVRRDYGEVPCDLLVPEVYSSRRIILYVHGGSFVGGSCKSWRNFCASLANACSCRVVVPEFRLAPSHPYPASIDDLITVFRVIFSEEEVAAGISSSGEFDGAQIILAADGSGASLATALMFKINKKYRASVRNIIFFSPWLDVTSECPLIAGRHVSDEVLSGDAMHKAADLYTFSTNLSNHLVSPLKASVEDFEGFPTIYIQIGEKEILLDQAREFKNILERAGVECIIDEWPKMMYMFQMADEFLPQSHLAVEKIGKFIIQREGESEAEREEREKILLKNNIRDV